MKLRHVLIFVILLLFTQGTFAQKKSGALLRPRVAPSVDDLLKISKAGWSATISPDGRFVAYDITTPDFERDRNFNQIWIAEIVNGQTFQLTKGNNSLYGVQWSPDGKWLTYISSNQVFAIPAAGGEPVQLTKAKNGVGYFCWSPDGRQIAFTSNENEPTHVTERKAHYGNFVVVDERMTSNNLWIVDVDTAPKEPVSGTRLIEDISISGLVAPISWSPDGSKIAFSGIVHEAMPDLSSDIFVLTLVDGSVKQIVSQNGRDRDPQWSPDGRKIIFSSDMGESGLAAYTFELAVVDAVGGPVHSITDGFDDNPRLVAWNKDGIYFWAWQKAAAHLFRLNPISKEWSRIPISEQLSTGGFSFDADGSKLAFTASSPTSINEVFLFDLKASSTRQLTDMTAQVKHYDLGVRQTITWKNEKDRVELGGVLTKPSNFFPEKKYPLFVIIHGGPSEASYPILLSWRYYPIDAWTSRGAMVLEVNYRGSSGHGTTFNDIAYRSFVQQGSDIMSGIDDLIKKGWVDSTKIVCMGWSHGGYLTSLLAATSNRFKAVSVGAAIFDWSNFYYHSSQGGVLGKDYLGDNPLNDPDIYRVVSPSNYLKGHRTPTLIQHGELDMLVPVSQAYHQRKSLKDLGVKVEMIIYNGVGHGINKPRSLRAATDHNFYWFNHFIWGDALPDFSNPVNKTPSQQGD